MERPLEFLYDVYDDEKATFGDAWCFNGVRFPRQGDVLIARYEPEEGSDGIVVEIYGAAAPARFYRLITTMTRFNADTEETEELGKCEIATGSGRESARLVHRMAIAISTGMLGIRPCQG